MKTLGDVGMSNSITGSVVTVFSLVVFSIGVIFLSNSLWDLKHSDNKRAFSSKFYSGCLLIFFACVIMIMNFEWMFK